MKTTDIQALKEKLAAIEHERWSDWQAWCHKILREVAPSPELEKVLERWDKQIATEYNDLTDREKSSDMEQVNRYWPLIEEYVRQGEYCCDCGKSLARCDNCERLWQT